MRGYELTERGKIFLAVLLVLILLVVPATVIAITSAAGKTPEPEEPTASLPSGETPPASVSESPPAAPDNTPEGPATQPPDNTPEETATQPPDNTPEQTATQPPDNTPEETATQPPDNTPEQTATQPPDNTPEQTVTEPPDNTPEETATQPPDNTPEQTVTEPPEKPEIKPSGNDSNSSSLVGGKLSFIFYPYAKQKLDRQMNSHIDAFLEMPDYLPNYKIIVETPKISGYGAQMLMRSLTSALVKRGVRGSMLEYESTAVSALPDSFSVKLYFVSIKVK